VSDVGAGTADLHDPERIGRELAHRLATGDPDATRLLYRAYGRLVFSIAFRILGDTGQAEDATQAAFTKLWQASSRVDPDRDVRPLLFTIARRASYDLNDSARLRRWDPLENAPEQAVDDGTERLAAQWQVREALDQLPDEERKVISLQHLDQMSHSEIAQHLGLPLGTVKSRSFRAHKHLLAILKPRTEEVV
jgi:RNA polymerase sigma-70 factor (ECF subfamily)